VVPSVARAAAVAGRLGRLSGGSVRIAALAPGWRQAEEAGVVIGTPAAIARALGTSALKLGEVETLVLDGADLLLEPVPTESLETLLVSVPAEAQRVVTAAALTREVDQFVEAHARRAMTIPSRSPDTESRTAATLGTVSYMVVPAARKETTLARLLDAAGARRIAVRGRRRGEALRERLRMRGYTEAEVSAFADGGATGAAIAFDVPPDAEGLAALDLEHAVVLVEPDELPHLRAIAADARLELRARPVERESSAKLGGYRNEIRRALLEEDIDAQMLVLDPLFDEASPAEVAAALSALVRRRTSARGSQEQQETPPPESGAPAKPRAFVRLFVGVGQKDGVRPADIVGSFTGEAGITGEQIGRIEIRDTFSVVEIDPDTADRVIRALNGTTMRGRSLRVDYDRKSPSPPQQRRRTRPS
ncbi:MAG: DbpA RNA binding domain-containing protein, partial [Longimicrobiales bacterium]